MLRCSHHSSPLFPVICRAAPFCCFFGPLFCRALKHAWPTLLARGSTEMCTTRRTPARGETHQELTWRVCLAATGLALASPGPAFARCFELSSSCLFR